MPSPHSVFGEPPPPRRRQRNYSDNAFPDGYGQGANRGPYQDGGGRAGEDQATAGRHSPKPGSAYGASGQTPAGSPRRGRRGSEAPGATRPDRGAYRSFDGGDHTAWAPVHGDHEYQDGYDGYGDDSYGGGYGDDGDNGGDGDGDSAKRGKRSWRQRLLLGALVSIIVVCLLGIGVTAYGIHLANRLERFKDLELDTVAKGDPINYLIIGSDSRSEPGTAGGSSTVEGQRADSIVLFRVDPKAEQVAVLSFPRDLRVPLARNGSFDRTSRPDQINHAYAQPNGRDDLIQTIRENFGIPIHHYVEINFAGFERLIDSVGGIEVFIDEPVHDRASGLLIERTGCVSLDGEEALALVRSRNPMRLENNQWVPMDPTADLGRGNRQQEFIRQALGKALKEAPTNPNGLRNVIETLADTVGLDDSISISDLLDLVEQFRGLDPENPEAVLTLQLPVDDAGDMESGYELWLREDEAEPLFNVFRGLPLDEVSPHTVNLTVLNGTGAEDQALNVAGAFQEIGFTIVELGDDPEEPERTTVYHAPGQRNLGLRIARHITGGAHVIERDDIRSGDVHLVTGADFETVHETPTPVDEMTDTDPDPGTETSDQTDEGPADDTDEAAPGAGEDEAADDDGDDGGGNEDTGPAATPSTTVHGTGFGEGGSCP